MIDIFLFNFFVSPFCISLALFEGFFGNNNTKFLSSGIFEKSTPAFTFIYPKLCSTIKTPFSIEIIFFDSFNTH